MPTWDKILEEIKKCSELSLLEKYLKSLNKFTNRAVILYFSAFTFPKKPTKSPFFLSIVDQDIQGFMTCSKDINNKNLDLILHTPGGDYEATKRIIDYLHSKYEHIRVFVPHMAMSGGTLIACSADEIYMGPYSSLGPTDPQVPIDGRYVPVGAVINEFYQAFDEVSKDPKKILLWRERLNKIPIGLINSLETMKINSTQYLKELLKKRNLKTLANDEIVERIVNHLNEHKFHSSHGKGINIETAMKLGLNVKNLTYDKKLEDLVLTIYHISSILVQKPTIYKLIINHKGRKFIVQNNN